MKPKLHSYLKRSRLQRGLSVRDVARLSGSKVSHVYVNQLENGIKKVPSPHILFFIAKGLKIDYLYLMYLAGYMTGRDARVKSA